MTSQRDLFGLDPPPDKEDSENVTLTLIMHGDVGASVKVSQTDTSSAMLLPKSEVAIEPTGRTTQRVGHPKYAIVEVTMPSWLAHDRGLI